MAAGSPIGLLLALTYPASSPPPVSGPSVMGIGIGIGIGIGYSRRRWPHSYWPDPEQPFTRRTPR